ncbi:MAG: 16S rRNA processing protein RimM [Clostridia bacterium]|nr:ribosome maturation factor RimM [Lachnospiraceae bacterium]NCC01945.1 16S rRNA processing protein RimM [Clostridia bacterium]NCD03940.1 16S rRNA processing protein RimM [Clostridia bacterium]
MEDYLRVGVIANTHGIRGEVKIFSTTDDITRFKKLKECFIDTGKTKIPVEVEGCKFFKQTPILKFKTIDRIEDVEGFKGKDLLVTRDNAVKLQKNEFFIVDLIGLEVESDEGMSIGILSDVLQTGANDVFIVKTEAGEEVLIPYIEQCVPEIQPETGKIIVHLLPGLLDLNRR